VEKLLEIKDLHVSFTTHVGDIQAVRGVSLDVSWGETLAIVGESGSGKSVTAQSIMRLIPNPPGRIEKGEILFAGKNLARLSEHEMRRIRGAEISMIFQDPMTSLNPTMTIEKQIMESIFLHQHVSHTEAKAKALELMELVGIPNASERMNQYPHQFSGGMRQRVVIAVALACNPKMIIADEPTTALDVTIQAQILELLKDIQAKMGTAIIFITHDLGVVANIADRVAVMYAGKIVEIGQVDEIFHDPRHPYTWGLLKSMPSLDQNEAELYTIPGSPPDLFQPPKGDAFALRSDFALKIDFEVEPPLFKVTDTHYAATWLLHPQARPIKFDKIRETKKTKINRVDQKQDKQREKLLEVKNLKQHFYMGKNKIVKAVDGLSFHIYKGETFGLVGESGCGKSTTGRTISRLYEATAGQITFNGQAQESKRKKKFGDFSRKVQMIFQDPYSSLNPRFTVADLVAEGIDLHGLAKNRQERLEKVYELLETVGLNREHANRYPHEFSGGQRQRIGIARALAVDPEFIIADEPISALDVSIQAQIVNLLKRLQKEKGLTYLFIAHDLSMVKYISDRIGVMYKGRLVEIAESTELYRNPLHAYTKSLLSAIPLPNPDYERNRNRITFDKRNYAMGQELRSLCEISKGHWVDCTESEYKALNQFVL
jgi:peptide/nickel transport system ATP-binding protein